MPGIAKQAKKPEYDGSTPLKSIMQEMFVTNLLKGMTQYEAYNAAGYKTKVQKQQISNASTLKANKRVLARITYKQAIIAKKAEITVEGQTKRLQEISASAQAKDQNGAAVAAEREINTICGLRDAEGTTNVNVITVADIFARTGAKSLTQPIIDAPALPSGDDTGDMGDNTAEGD